MLDQLIDHVAENGPHSVEPFVRVADVRQTSLVEENLLDDEDGDSLGELRARFHDAQAERDDLRGQEEVNDGIVVVLL